MLKLKAKMFDEAGKSYASKNLFTQIVIFLLVFFIIYLLESIVPSLVTVPKMMEELNSDSEIMEGSKKLTWSESMALATRIAGKPEVMIPTLLSTIFGTLGSIFYCRCIEMRPLSSMGMRKRKMGSHYLLGLGVGLAMMTAITMLTVVTGANSIKLCTGISWKIIALFFMGFFVQGMSEEFVFRGYFMTTIGGSNNKWLAVLISSAAFGMAHLANPGINVLAMINLILFGVFAALYMIYFDDIWGGCAIHSVWNFTQGNIYGISVSGSGDSESVFRTTAKSSHDFLTGGKFGIEGSIFTTVVLAAGTGIVVYLMMKREKQDTTAQDENTETAA
ncbi:MAG: CPBP family intramembrane metalloprotease [Ruminococcus sp.]|nr:CPBP family intramembrane metalloprotease [Ruminococcus sp.]